MVRPIRLSVLVVLVASPAWAGATLSLDNETPRGICYTLDLAAGHPRVIVCGFSRPEGAPLPPGISVELVGPSGTWTLSGAGELSEISVALAEGERAELVLVAREVQRVAFVELRLKRGGAIESSEIVYLPDSPPPVPVGEGANEDEEPEHEGVTPDEEPTLEELKAKKEALEDEVAKNELLAEIALLEARLARLEGYAHLYVPAPGTYAYAGGSPGGTFRVSYYGYGGSYGGPYVYYGWPYLYSGSYYAYPGYGCYYPAYGCYGGGVGLYYHTGNFYFAAGTSHCFR
ncbi:MAG: hypothetical protein HY720_06825 [Planctomycetes bacterium]|nr:hypothetical protein [Planctomycetota bacterium]